MALESGIATSSHRTSSPTGETDLQRLKRDSESARVPAATSAAAKSHLGIWKLIIPVVIVVLAVSGYFYLHPHAQTRR
jgi:Na+/H+ antiporter NhaC